MAPTAVSTTQHTHNRLLSKNGMAAQLPEFGGPLHRTGSVLPQLAMAMAKAIGNGHSEIRGSDSEIRGSEIRALVPSTSDIPTDIIPPIPPIPLIPSIPLSHAA